MNAAAWQFNPAVGRQVKIRKIHRKESISIFDSGTQELERLVFESQDQTGKMPRLSIIEAVREIACGENVPMPVKHAAGITVFQNTRPAIG
jgi:hypothetical protein